MSSAKSISVSACIAVLIGLCLFSGSAFGAPDCFAVAKIPLSQQQYNRSVVILLDETVVFDETQKDHVREQVLSQIVAGHEVRILTFSAFRDGRYTLPVATFRVPPMLDEKRKYTMRKDHIRDFETCAKRSLSEGRKITEQVLSAYFASSSRAIANSDILSTLKSVGDAVFPVLKSKQKRLLLISDMLENSDLMSFYGAGGTPRNIDANAEIKKLGAASLRTSFGGAQVWVIGGGIAPSDPLKSAASYRSHAFMAPLEQFWKKYFAESGAELVEFGKPLLLASIGGKK